jgi:hypothetical protein
MPGSWLHNLLGENCETNSFHHQAVNKPGNGLFVSAVRGTELSRDWSTMSCPSFPFNGIGKDARDRKRYVCVVR